MKKAILPVWRLPRPLAALLLVGALSSCAQMKKAFAPSPHTWPAPREHQVKKDGLRLRAYGGSFKSPALAALDAREALKRYLQTLDIPAEPAERELRVQAALKAFSAVPARTTGQEGHAAVIDLELSALQKLLGTQYD